MKLLNLLFFISIFSVFSQEQKPVSTESISNEICTCISNINTETADKNAAIKSCIDLSLKTINQEKNVQIIKNIEAHILENCSSLKKLLLTENQEFKHSTSSNVLAQLAYDDGMDYMDERDYQSAIEKFKKATEIDPKFAFAWDNLGISYRKLNQLNKAIEAYKQSLKINSKGRLPLMNIAVAYNLSKNYEQAIKYYKKFIHYYENDPEGYYGLGLVQYVNQQQEEGLDNLIHAYTIYTAENSPFKKDAAKKIGYMYNDLKNQNKQDVFNRVAEKYNLKIESN